MGQSGYSKSSILLIWPNLDLFLSMTVKFVIANIFVFDYLSI